MAFVTGHRDGSAVKFHQFLDQSQSDAGAFVRTALGAFDAMKTFE